MHDEGLAAGSRDGDREAFAKLYDRWSARIYAYHYYRSFSRETAEDLTSQTFLKALEGLPGYLPERGTFSAWLYGIARNCLADCVRARARTVQLEFDEDGEAGDGWEPGDGWDLSAEAEFEHDVAERDRWERLKPHLAALDASVREIIILRLWDGLSHSEIARITGRTEAACKMAYSRALAVLRDSMPLVLFIVFLASKPGA
ncbi:MAG: sigma-70 family RNA polymerase sigma factor [Spirochaetes bacterium]|nr:sigma-70 family RNA polymerase sigma factor [Spirochaetota bacterium]